MRGIFEMITQVEDGAIPTLRLTRLGGISLKDPQNSWKISLYKIFRNKFKQFLKTIRKCNHKNCQIIIKITEIVTIITFFGEEACNLPSIYTSDPEIPEYIYCFPCPTVLLSYCSTASRCRFVTHSLYHIANKIVIMLWVTNPQRLDVLTSRLWAKTDKSTSSLITLTSDLNKSSVSFCLFCATKWLWITVLCLVNHNILNSIEQFLCL